VVDKKELAYQDYLNGMKYKEIAEKYGVTINTVKSWKTRYKWSRDGVHTKEKSVHTKNKPKKARAPNKKETEEPIVESGDLTDKQRLFCMYYVKYFNATKAYQKAYGCDYFSAKAHGYKLLQNVAVKAEIDRLKKELAEGIMLDATAVLQKYIDIAFADITDFVEFGTETIQGDEFTEELTGVDQSYTANYVRFKNAAEVDGTIITEVKQGRDGVSIKLADKMKALDKLAQYFDLFPDKFKRRIEEEKLKLAQQQKQQVEVETPIFVDDVDEED